MSLKNFLLSRIFLKNVGLAVIIFVGIIMLLLLWLNLYTRHGQARPVPDFYGLSMEQTAKLAKKSRLRYQVIDSLYTSLVPRGCVAEQSPKPGFKVKKWRNIALTINAYNPEMVAMPNLVDLPIRQALAMITSSGLEMGELRYRPDLSIDVVIEQLYNGRTVAGGDSLQKGSVIDLVLGKGLSNQRTPVPDLIGMTLEPARNKILVSSLNLGTYIFDNTIRNSDDSANAFVYKQIPGFHEEASLQLGSPIYLWLTVDSSLIQADTTLIISNDSLSTVDQPQEPSN